MKKVFLFIVLALALVLDLKATPFYIQGYNSDGSPQTNLLTMTAWPIAPNPFVVVGTNNIYEGNTIVIAPNSSGYASNWCYPGQYILTVSNVNKQFVVSVPDTTNFQSLALYIINQPVFTGVSLNSFGLITNLLGYWPATNNTTGIVFALGYTPATNTTAGIIWSLGYTPATNSYLSISNLLAFVPATNSPAGITNALNYMPATNSLACLLYLLGYTPATNSYLGISNLLAFVPATNSPAGITNALNYMPATNTPTGIVTALGYTPPPSTFSGITNALGYMPRTNDGYTGLPALSGVASISTNGFICWVAYKTNNLPGAQLTNLPQGSLMLTTNGSGYILTNLVWQPISI